MSRDLGRDVPDLEKLYARKLWAVFSHPILSCPARNLPICNSWALIIGNLKANDVANKKAWRGPAKKPSEDAMGGWKKEGGGKPHE